MTYTKKQFLEDVKKEAVALKKNATDEELSKLNFNSLDASDSRLCIYGQMTSNCKSDRAVELIQKCCPRFFKNEFPSFTLTGALGIVNGTTVEGGIDKDRSGGWISHLSAIETYICIDSNENKNLIDFLKGNRKDLVL